MAKQELLTLAGRIEDIFPDGRFAVRLDNDRRIIAYSAGRMRRIRGRAVVGDSVTVEMSPYDADKGRIIYRDASHTPPADQSERGRR